jgi:fatty acid desaturase
MSDVEAGNGTPGISLRKSIAIYAIFLVIMLALISFSSGTTWFPGIIGLIAYFVFGFLLNRIVLRNLVEWHPMYNTIGNVSSAKLSTFVLWPISYLFLFIKLTINKVL